MCFYMVPPFEAVEFLSDHDLSESQHLVLLPYRNTLADVLKVPVDDPKSLCFRMCFYMVGAQRLEL